MTQPRPAGAADRPEPPASGSRDGGSLRMITFRGEPTVIRELKDLARVRGMPYQVLLREALKTYVAQSAARKP